MLCILKWKLLIESICWLRNDCHLLFPLLFLFSMCRPFRTLEFMVLHNFLSILAPITAPFLSIRVPRLLSIFTNSLRPEGFHLTLLHPIWPVCIKGSKPSFAIFIKKLQLSLYCIICKCIFVFNFLKTSSFPICRVHDILSIRL